MFSDRSLIRTRIGGFSLIEVLITSAIIGIVTAIVVIKYGAFNSSVLLRNQAFEVALSIREAQVFSVSVRGDDNPSFRESFGVYVDMGAVPSPTQQYMLFVDANVNDRYDTNEEVDTLTIDSRFEIFDVCLGDDSALDCGLEDLSVTFSRPDFDAKMFSTPGASSNQLGTIKLRGINDNSVVREIDIRSTGLISVD